MKPRPGDKRENWLLIKERDEHVRPARGVRRRRRPSPTRRPRGARWTRSPRAGSTAVRPPLTPGPSGPAGEAAGRSGRAQRRSTVRPRAAPASAGAVPGPLPARRAVPAGDAGRTRRPRATSGSTRSSTTATGSASRSSAGSARVLTRNGQDWTDRFAGSPPPPRRCRPRARCSTARRSCCDADGRSDFGLLQEALAEQGPAAASSFVAFDLLYLDGFDLRGEPLVPPQGAARGRCSAARAARADSATSSTSWAAGPPSTPRRASCCSRARSPSAATARGCPGARRDWVKVKCLARAGVRRGRLDRPGGRRARASARCCSACTTTRARCATPAGSAPASPSGRSLR